MLRATQVDTCPDDLLAQRLAGGDSQAWELLLARYWDLGYRIALRHTHDPGTAEDVVQEALVRLLASVHRFEPETVVGSLVG